MTSATYYTTVVAQDMMYKGYTHTPHTTPYPHCIHVHTTPGTNMDHVVASGALVMCITGQSPQWTRARQAMAGFRLRQDQLLGCRVTLRHHMMWNFLHKVVHMAWTRQRDYRGLPMTSMNALGHWSIGVGDVFMYPEVECLWDYIPGVQGLDMSFVCSPTSPPLAACLWSALAIPVKTS